MRAICNSALHLDPSCELVNDSRHIEGAVVAVLTGSVTGREDR